MKKRLIDLPEENDYDYDRMKTLFPELEAMKEAEQNPAYHGEGNAEIHTRLVCRAVTELPEWAGLGREERGILYLSALFHDIGKPVCTKLENGVFVSPKHTVTGSKIFRRMIYKKYASQYEAAFREREEIAWLIRYHGLPLHFWDRDRAEARLCRAAESVRLPLLYMLSKADILGRICEDTEDLLCNVECFREYGREINCYEGKPEFACDYTRFKYYNTGFDEGSSRIGRGTPLFDETEFTVFLMAGLPLAGKDTYIGEHLKEIPIVSLDDIRQEWGVSPADGSGAVADEARKRARVFLRRKESFVWDATNTVLSTRQKLRRLFEDYGARVITVYVEAPYEELLRRNKKRDRSVPEAVIDRMLEKMDMVEPSEGYGVIYSVGV